MPHEENDEFEIEYTESFLKDIERYRKTGQKSVLKKISILIDELRKHPYIGTGKPEALKGNRATQWSRRITQKHRLIYEIHEDEVVVLLLAAYGHYDDK